MFLTEHLEGRLRYETDKVVCIDIHINTNYSNGDNLSFLGQALLSLVNKQYVYTISSFSTNGYSVSNKDLCTEVDEWIKQYLQTRKVLELD